MVDRREIEMMRKDVKKSFTNVNHDLREMHRWVDELHNSNKQIPHKFDVATDKIVTSLERELNRLQDMFAQLAETSRSQFQRIDSLEKTYDDISKKAMKLETIENKIERILDRKDYVPKSTVDSNETDSHKMRTIENKLNDILIRVEKLNTTPKPKPKPKKPQSKKKVFYWSGVKGSKFHIRACPSYRRIKNPKSYQTVAQAKKTGMTFCKLCIPTEK